MVHKSKSVSKGRRSAIDRQTKFSALFSLDYFKKAIIIKILLYLTSRTHIHLWFLVICLQYHYRSHFRLETPAGYQQNKQHEAEGRLRQRVA